MIDTAISCVLDELNGYLATRFPGQDKMAVMASLARPDGGRPVGLDDKLVLSLVNIEPETQISATGFVVRAGKTNASVRLNLYVMVAASYAGNYGHALNMLGQAMACFRERPCLDAQNSGSFPDSMLQIDIEMMSLSLSELHTLWSVNGASYLPSVVYKLRVK